VAGEVTASFTTGENLTYARIRQSARESSPTAALADTSYEEVAVRHSPLAEVMLGEQAITVAFRCKSKGL
jgi:hypothetical protein